MKLRWIRSRWGYRYLEDGSKVEHHDSSLKRRLARHHYAFILLLSLFLVGATKLFIYFYITSGSQKVLSTPLLSGAPQFTLLALIVGLSAYLRTVRSNAVELRDKIAGGGVWNYPIEGDRRFLTGMKLELLDNVATKLLLMSPLLVMLFMGIAARALFDAVNDAMHFTQASRILTSADIVILTWTTSVFILLGLFHFNSRVRDDRIRAVARTFESELLTTHKEQLTSREKEIEVESIAES